MTVGVVISCRCGKYCAIIRCKNGNAERGGSLKLQAIACSYLCRDGYAGQWYSTLFVAHGVVIATLNSFFFLPLPSLHLSDFLGNLFKNLSMLFFW